MQLKVLFDDYECKHTFRKIAFQLFVKFLHKNFLVLLPHFLVIQLMLYYPLTYKHEQLQSFDLVYMTAYHISTITIEVKDP